MADARRWVGGRYHPAFLTCLMLVVSVLMLLQYTYCGPTATTSRPALNSILTEHHRNFISTSLSPADSNITTAVEEFMLVEPEEDDHALISQSLGEVVSVEQTVSEETESLKAGDVPDSIVAPDSIDAPTGEHDLGEFAGEEFVGLESSDNGKQVEQFKLAETEHDVGGSEESFHGDFPNATGQVQSKEIESPEKNEQPMSTSQQPSKISPVSKEPKPNNPIFQELQACKTAINEASHDSADPNLYKHLYKNVTAFSKSYELMEKVFKVYTYRDGRKPLVHSGPMIGIYASEGQFIERMKRASQYRVDDPSKAHMFFLPYSVQHMVTHLYVPNSHTMLPLATFIKQYVEALARKYPFWNRTHGADHFFVSCHDWGPATARDHPTLRSNAMKVVCNADTTEEFVLGKDASLPEVYIHKLRSKAGPEKLGGPRYDQRPYLAFFAGQMHGRVRPILLSLWKDKDPDMKIYEVLPKQIARVVSYNQHMKMSKYCICAMGYEVNSPRIVEAIYNDCVPVIIADNFVLPFSDVLNWEAFSVTVPERDIPRLKTLLSDIPEKSYRAMQRRLKLVRPHFVWHDTPEKYDAFHMILHSVWTSRLNRLQQIRESVSGELF